MVVNFRVLLRSLCNGVVPVWTGCWFLHFLLWSGIVIPFVGVKIAECLALRNRLRWGLAAVGFNDITLTSVGLCLVRYIDNEFGSIHPLVL